MRKLNWMFLCVVVALTSCSNEGINPSENDNTTNEVIVQPLELTQIETSLVEQNNNFAWNLFEGSVNEFQGEKSVDNLSIAPLNATLNLSMALNGAANATYDELLHGLGYSDFDLATVNDFNQKLSYDLAKVDEGVTVKIANSLWNTPQISMYDEFVSILKNKYNAECFEKGDNTTEMMRNWVKNATEGFISDYAPYCEGARITLLNALCLKGKWAKKCKFDPQQTKNDKFTNYKGEEKSVPFMNKSLYCGYRQLNRVQLVSLPMGQETFNMVFIVPNQGVEIKDCLSEAKEAFIKHQESPQTSYVILSLPKFDVSATIVIDDVLKGLGITEMFKPTADFSKMCDGNLTAFGVQ